MLNSHVVKLLGLVTLPATSCILLMEYQVVKFTYCKGGSWNRGFPVHKPCSQAAGGPKEEVEYIQTFFAVSCSHGWVPPSCEVLTVYRMMAHFPLNNNMQTDFGHTGLLPYG